MGTLLASKLIEQASEIIEDELNVVWGTDQGLSWLNDGQRAIVIQRPDASTNTHSIQLIPGTRQPITGLRLMSVVRNMGIDGLTPGRAIRLVERGMKDDSDPDWHNETAATVIKEYVFDTRVPKIFYVSPPVHATTAVQIEISEAVNPADVPTINDPITLDDIYGPILIEWILYRFLSRDSEKTPDIARAAAHAQAFISLLGVKLSPDLAISPKVREQLS